MRLYRWSKRDDSVQPFDQDAWASLFQYGKRDAKQSLEVFRVLRENNLAMLKALPREIWDNYGMHLERGKETHLARRAHVRRSRHQPRAANRGIVAQLKKKAPKKKKAGKKKRK